MLFSNPSMASGSGPREKQSPRQIILSTFLFDFIILRDSFKDSRLEWMSVIIAKVIFYENILDILLLSYKIIINEYKYSWVE